MNTGQSMPVIWIHSSLAWLSGLLVSGGLVAVGLLLGFPLSGLPAAIGLLAGLLVLIKLQRLRASGIGAICMLLLGNAIVFMLAWGIACLMWGMGWDGQSQHQRVVNFLIQGIVPNNTASMNEYFADQGIYHNAYHPNYDNLSDLQLYGAVRVYLNEHRDEILSGFEARTGGRQQALAATRGSLGIGAYEVRSVGLLYYALIGKVGRVFEGGKAYNLILVIMAIGLMFSALKSLSLGTKSALVLALLSALNPVSIVQWFTFSVDTQVASLVAILIAWSLLLLSDKKSIYWAGFMMTAILLASTKLNGIIYVLLLGLFILPLVRNIKRLFANKRIALIMLACVVLLVGAISYTLAPRIIKLNSRGQVDLHYLADKSLYYMRYDAVGLASLQKMSSPERMLRSLLNQTNHGKLQPKLPFSLHLRELKMYTKLYEGPELGGYGPFFSGCLLFAGILCLAMVRRKHEHKSFILCLAGGIFVFSLFMPSAYLARLNPILWLVPILVGVLSLAIFHRGGCWLLARLLVCALCLNVGYVLVLHLYGQAHIQPAVRKQMHIIANLTPPVTIAFNYFEAVERRFHSQGIAFKAVERIPPDQPSFLLLRTPPGHGVGSGVQIWLDPSDPKSTFVYRELLTLQEELSRRLIPVPIFNSSHEQMEAIFAKASK